MIAAATRGFLSAISPNDAAGPHVLREECRGGGCDLDGCLSVPLLLGSLEPKSALPSEVAQVRPQAWGISAPQRPHAAVRPSHWGLFANLNC